jgi:uncharacterized delta-60 repeat protein
MSEFGDILRLSRAAMERPRAGGQVTIGVSHMQNRANVFGALGRSARTQGGAAKSKNIFKLEPLERRLFMTGTVASGAPSVLVGTPYTLNFDIPSQNSVSWNVDWGDGATSTSNGLTPSVTHTYAAASATRTVTATASAIGNPLDTTFGTGGKVTTNLGTADDYAYDVAIQPDGKILVAGGPNFSLIRYNADGSLDTTFGGGDGWVTEPGTNKAFGIALQLDGKILVGGGENFSLARFNTDGTLDTTFGNGTGKTVSGFGVTYDAYDFAVVDGGKIVMVGTNNGSNFITARFNADGSLDTSFGTAGRTTTDFFGSLDKAFALAVQSDGKLVVVGQARDGSTNYKWALARYTAEGALDTSFGTGGKITTDMGHNDDAAWALQILSNGQIVVAGRGGTASTGYDFGLARYNADGSLDTSFGGGGTGTTLLHFGAGGDQAYALKVLSDGKLFLAGRAQHSSNAMDFGLARYHADGTIDSTFANGGKLRTDFRGSTDQGEAVAIQADGAVVVAGGSSVVNGNGAMDLAVARYHTSLTAMISVQVVASVVASVIGDVAVDEGSTYTLGLMTSQPGVDLVENWAIDWGDGSAIQHYAGNLTSATHVYADGLNEYTILARAITGDIPFTANPLSLEVRNVAPVVTLSGVPNVYGGTPAPVLAIVNDPGSDGEPTYAWSVSRDGGPFRTDLNAQTSEFLFVPDQLSGGTPIAGTYAVRVAVTDKDGGTTFASGTINVPNSGIVAHWGLDQLNGEVAPDGAGNGHELLLRNGPVWRPYEGAVEGALAIDGVDDTLNAPTVQLPGTSFTVAWWMKPHVLRDNGDAARTGKLRLNDDGADHERLRERRQYAGVRDGQHRHGQRRPQPVRPARTARRLGDQRRPRHLPEMAKRDRRLR